MCVSRCVALCLYVSVCSSMYDLDNSDAAQSKFNRTFFFLRVDDWLRNNDVHTIFFTAEVSILLRINSASVHIAHVIYHGS